MSSKVRACVASSLGLGSGWLSSMERDWIDSNKSDGSGLVCLAASAN